jgi:RNA recognition motif-containing protein
LKHYGVESFKDLTLVEDGNEGTNCGFAFLEFSSRSDAKEAYKRLQKTDIAFGDDKPSEISFVDSFIDLGDDIMAQVFFWISFPCFCQGLMYSTCKTWFFDLIRAFGNMAIGTHIYVGFKISSGLFLW